MREKRKKKPLNVQIGLRIKECRLNRNMTQEHVSEQPNVTRQYVSILERGVTGLLSQHSSTCAKSRIPAPTTFCWANGQVPTRCSMPGSISSRMSRRRRSWTPSKTSHSLRNCPGSSRCHLTLSHHPACRSALGGSYKCFHEPFCHRIEVFLHG